MEEDGHKVVAGNDPHGGQRKRGHRQDNRGYQPGSAAQAAVDALRSANTTPSW